MTETRNPRNFIIATLKVSVTKVQGFFDLKVFNFQTSFHIGVREARKVANCGECNYNVDVAYVRNDS